MPWEIENSKQLEILFNSSKKYTFLVGAGASIDKPSCLSSADEIKSAILKFYLPSDEYKKISKIARLPYELVIQMFQWTIDTQHQLNKYFNSAIQPNLIHGLIAEMIINKHYAVTTNFDNLIEYALINRVDEKAKIYPIITKDNFEQYKNPSSLFDKGFYPLYKIHGSSDNIVRSEDIEDSIVTTLFDLGREKKNTFDLVDYKKKSLEFLLKDRSLVVMGYSGSDQFDIIPALQKYLKIKEIIWINHVTKNNRPTVLRMKLNRTITNIFPRRIRKTENESTLENLLLEIARKWRSGGKKRDKIKIYIINVNTHAFIQNFLFKQLLEIEPTINHNVEDSNTPEFSEWLREYGPRSSKNRRYEFAFRLYEALGQLDESLRLAEKLQYIHKKIYNQGTQLGWDFLRMGFVLNNQNKYTDALKNFKLGLKEAEKIQDEDIKLNALRGMADVNKELGNFQLAQKEIHESLAISKRTKHWGGYARGCQVYARLLWKMGNKKKSKEIFDYTIKLADQFGDLKLKAWTLYFRGFNYKIFRQYKRRKDALQEAHAIAVQIGDDDLVYRIKKYSRLQILIRLPFWAFSIFCFILFLNSS